MSIRKRYELGEMDMEPDVVYSGFQVPQVGQELFRFKEGIPAVESLVGILVAIDKVHWSFNSLLAKLALVSYRHLGPQWGLLLHRVRS